MTEHLTAKEIEEIVRNAVRDEFEHAGIITATPTDRSENRQDFLFLRRFRKFYMNTSTKIGGTVIMAVASGVLWLVYTGFQSFVQK